MDNFVVMSFEQSEPFTNLAKKLILITSYLYNYNMNFVLDSFFNSSVKNSNKIGLELTSEFMIISKAQLVSRNLCKSRLFLSIYLFSSKQWHS